MPLKLFISYAHEDEVFKDVLLEHLAGLQRRGFIQSWQDGLIEVGAEWRHHIDIALTDCDIALLLVSRSFLASEFIHSVELARLLERRKHECIRVVPIIVCPCPWTLEVIGELQALPKGGKPITNFSENTGERDQVWTDIAYQLAKWAEETGNRKPDLACQRVDLSRLPVPAARFVGRESRLRELNTALSDSNTHVVALIAPGGVGKSALTDEWLIRLAPDYAGAKRVFAWSFYSQGSQGSHATATSSTPFFTQALPWFGDKGEPPRTDEERAGRLAAGVREKRTVLILDGVEPLQYPPQVQHGWFADVGIKLLLQDLTRNGLGLEGGLVLVSSRQPLEELTSFAGRGFQPVDLERLDETEGAALLNHLGVKGRDDELKAITREMGGHALALVLLGRLLVECCDGDVARRDTLPPLLDEADQGGHAQRVMRWYDEHFWPTEAPERRFLHLLGLLDRPLSETERQVLLDKANVAQDLKKLSVVDWNRVHAHLEQVGLLFRQPDVLGNTSWDTHPLVRDYFGRRLQEQDPEGWRQAHRILFEYFQSLPKTNWPDTLEELEPLYRAVHHGCLAGEYRKAREEVHRARIRRGDEVYSLYKLGAFAHDLSALAGFFREGWEVPISAGLSEPEKAELLASVAFCLMSLGRLREAIVPRRADVALFEQIQDWEKAARDAGNLANLLLPLGQLAEAELTARQAVEWAAHNENWRRQRISRTQLATVLHRRGALAEALVGFQETETLQMNGELQCPRLYSLQGARYCSLLLDRARSATEREVVLERGREALAIAIRNNWLLDIALAHLTVGHALVALDRLNEARVELEWAVIGIRKAGSINHIPEPLLARATFHRAQGELDRAWRDLHETLELTERCEMHLYEVDARLLEGHLHLDVGEETDARYAYERAAGLIHAMNYGLRFAELNLLAARLRHSQGQASEAQEHIQAARKRIEAIGQWGLLPVWEQVQKEISESR